MILRGTIQRESTERLYSLYNFVLRLSSTRAVKEMYYRSSMRLCLTQCIKILVKWWKSKKKKIKKKSKSKKIKNSSPPETMGKRDARDGHKVTWPSIVRVPQISDQRTPLEMRHKIKFNLLASLNQPILHNKRVQEDRHKKRGNQLFNQGGNERPFCLCSI